MSQSKQRDYPRLAKRGFLLGLGLFLVGAGGAIGGTALFGTLPAWSNTLFTDMELLGIVLVCSRRSSSESSCPSSSDNH